VKEKLNIPLFTSENYNMENMGRKYEIDSISPSCVPEYSPLYVKELLLQQDGCA